jgi:hypothetical protein
MFRLATREIANYRREQLSFRAKRKTERASKEGALSHSGRDDPRGAACEFDHHAHSRFA